MDAPSGSLELFETEYLNDFPKLNITAIVEYKDLIIVGDITGGITAFKKENKKYVNSYQIQPSKAKIDSLLCIEETNILYALTGGNLHVYELPNFFDKTPKDTDKESKDIKDLAKIVGNLSHDNKNELLVINKKKKLMFFSYKTEMQRLIHNTEYKDKEGKPLEISVKEVPEKIKWYGDNFCYFLKGSSKLIFVSIEKKGNESKLIQSEQDIPVEDIVYIQSSWVILTGGFGLLFDTKGQAMSKNMITFNSQDTFIQLDTFNDIYIVALYQKSISIYDYNDGSCVQELTADTNKEACKKFLSKGKKNIFVVSISKPFDKAKPEAFDTRLSELRELSFETQIKKLLNRNQLEKAFGIMNNKLDYNMEKFKLLESFYCECAWNCIKQKTKKDYIEAEKYFRLCNFNPFELMYHFIDLLKIKPIHEGYKDPSNLAPGVSDCQIKSSGDNNELNEDTSAALEMLINTLQVKKNYILTSNNIQLGNLTKDKTVQDTYEKTKNISLEFESSDNNIIKLKNVDPIGPKLNIVIEMINNVLIKAMVLKKSKLELIEDLIENDRFETEYPLDFCKNINTYESNMTLAYIYRKQKNYSEALKLIKPYLEDMSDARKSKQSRNLLTKILGSFGKDTSLAKVFEEGLRSLINIEKQSAFEILLSNELISIDDFLDKILPDFDKDNNNKRESFLRLLCDDKRYSIYSNEKYQTLYLELFLDRLFEELKQETVPATKNDEGLPVKYKNFKQLLYTYTKYNKLRILERVKGSWMYDVEIYLLTELQKYDEAIKKMTELVKSSHKSFNDIRDYCKNNYKNDVDVYKKYFKILRENYDSYSGKDSDNDKSMKEKFKKEMLKLLELFINGDLLDVDVKKTKNKLELLNILNPKEILALIPTDWKLNEPLDDTSKDKTLFNLLRYYLKEYAIINNNYKRLENLAKMDLVYKQMKLYELRDIHVSLDVNSKCYSCGKNISANSVFLVYPNGHIYHSRCSPDLHLEPKTGRNFENFDY